MSSNAPAIPLQIISSLYASVDCGVAVLAFLVYDWLLTLDDEIALFWQWGPDRKVTAGPVIVYALSRYVPILNSITGVITIYPVHSITSCRALVWIGFILGFVQQAVSAIFSAARVYALSGKKRLLAIITLLLSLVPAIINLLSEIKWNMIEDLSSPFYCSDFVTTPARLSLRLIMISRASLIAADMFVLFFTWRYNYASLRAQRGLNFGPSFSQIMVYHGSLYFIVLALLDVLHMILSALTIDTIFSAGSYVSNFMTPMVFVLISRFLLDLQQVAHGTESESMLSLKDIRFATGSNLACRSLPHFIPPFDELTHTGSIQWAQDIYFKSEECAESETPGSREGVAGGERA